MDDNNPSTSPSDSDSSSASTGLTIDRVLEILEKGDIHTEHGMLRWSSNHTFLITLRHEEVNLPAVYKPRTGERPLWDFPDGTLCRREVASFQTSRQLGWEIVPPTVLREGSRGIGSMQFFIEHDPEYNYFAFEGKMIPQLMQLAAFDYIVNNADRKGGHCLVDAQGHMWGIDHGITFHTAPKLRTVVWDFAGQTIPPPLLDDLERLSGCIEDETSDYRQTMSKLVTESEILSFLRRIRQLLRTKRYPQPGPGPNYPWPPV